MKPKLLRLFWFWELTTGIGNGNWRKGLEFLLLMCHRHNIDRVELVGNQLVLDLIGRRLFRFGISESVRLCLNFTEINRVKICTIEGKMGGKGTKKVFISDNLTDQIPGQRLSWLITRSSPKKGSLSLSLTMKQT